MSGNRILFYTMIFSERPLIKQSVVANYAERYFLKKSSAA